MLAWAWRLALVLVALVGASGLARAQQNLFNVPSGEISAKGSIFFQEQFNFSPRSGTSNTTVDFGLGNNWEVGFNFLDLEFYDNPRPGPSTGQTNPDLLFNMQKGFELTEWAKIGIGT